ncbi:MAG: substrate-binding domain-containing protein [Propionibacteriaceae bacterium]|nr:substrate-binding domain-containing protein [Micropruina sp.]HBX79656.1 sugar ABC transporter substrate-binding protein [Propionibacteriaceae bacterium]HBY23722.1 sugar ABC transporter substrate-binding protein [Propionibacteriaceae bacterium]
MKTKNWAVSAGVAVIALCLTVTGCSAGGTAPNTNTNGVSAKADAALKEIQGKVLSKGPHGEVPASRNTVALTEAEVTQIKAKGATAAIVMHYAGNDWATAQVNGLKAEFARLGIEVVAVTDANFKPDQQVSNIETVLAKKPSIIVSIPTDPVATAAAYKSASAAGVKLVFMDNVPNGLVAGTDYESVVSADNYGNGVVSAHLMAKSLGGTGKIGVIFHEADFFVTKQRYQGFTETIAKDYPDIKIVKSQGIAGPDFAGDAQKVADAMLSQNPDLSGIWAVWDVPAEGVMAAARAAGRNDLKIATEDLGTNVAIALAQNQLIVGLGAQQPYQQGVTEADIAAGALIGKKAPAYVALNALPVDHSNVLEAWKQVYNTEPPADLQKAFVK